MPDRKIIITENRSQHTVARTYVVEAEVIVE